MRVLLTGGAGYLGTHTALALIEAGHQVLICDDMSNATPESVSRVRQLTRTEVPLWVGDAGDTDGLCAFVRENAPVDAVIHFAGLKAVEESVADPLRYYRVNLGTALSVLAMMAREDISTIVFSSSATVYGTPDRLPLTEASVTGVDLANPYGRSKLMIETFLADVAAADPDLRATSLRYFNPVGAHPSGHFGEDPTGTPNNLMPYIARVAVGRLDRVGVFGDDYDTPDGTGQRDYLHVMDLAEAHLAALEHAAPGHVVYNLGTGRPTSVLELIDAFRHASGRDIPFELLPRRAGDVATSYCDPSAARSALGWRATRSIDQACADTWRWQSTHPHGYAPRPS